MQLPKFPNARSFDLLDVCHDNFHGKCLAVAIYATVGIFGSKLPRHHWTR